MSVVTVLAPQGVTMPFLSAGIFFFLLFFVVLATPDAQLSQKTVSLLAATFIHLPNSP